MMFVKKQLKSCDTLKHVCVWHKFELKLELEVQEHWTKLIQVETTKQKMGMG
jgi:hypothetical protein